MPERDFGGYKERARRLINRVARGRKPTESLPAGDIMSSLRLHQEMLEELESRIIQLAAIQRAIIERLDRRR